MQCPGYRKNAIGSRHNLGIIYPSGGIGDADDGSVTDQGTRGRPDVPADRRAGAGIVGIDHQEPATRQGRNIGLALVIGSVGVDPDPPADRHTQRVEQLPDHIAAGQGIVQIEAVGPADQKIAIDQLGDPRFAQGLQGVGVQTNDEIIEPNGRANGHLQTLCVKYYDPRLTRPPQPA